MSERLARRDKIRGPIADGSDGVAGSAFQHVLSPRRRECIGRRGNRQW
jgi:hypothetical protein